MKGYKLYDHDTHLFFVSRNVVFHEQVFPFKSKSASLPRSLASSDLPLPSSTESEQTIYDDLTYIAPPQTNFDFIPYEHTNSDAHSSIDNEHSHQPTPVRRSSRTHHLPKYLDAYQLNLPFTYTNTTTAHSIESHINTNHLSPSYNTFVANLSLNFESTTYHQAMQHASWRAAMDNELKPLEENNTWTIEVLPTGCHTLGMQMDV